MVTLNMFLYYHWQWYETSKNHEVEDFLIFPDLLCLARKSACAYALCVNMRGPVQALLPGFAFEQGQNLADQSRVRRPMAAPPLILVYLLHLVPGEMLVAHLANVFLCTFACPAGSTCSCVCAYARNWVERERAYVHAKRTR